MSIKFPLEVSSSGGLSTTDDSVAPNVNWLLLTQVSEREFEPTYGNPIVQFVPATSASIELIKLRVALNKWCRLPGGNTAFTVEEDINEPVNIKVSW